MNIRITPDIVAQEVEKAIPHIASQLPEDVYQGLIAALEKETHPRGLIALEQLVENAKIASCDHVPLCQDTGSVWICLEIGSEVDIAGNIFSQVDDAVSRAYDKACLRKSIVKDALFDRANTQTNTPAFCEVRFSDIPETALLHIMLKGGGSDNASRVVMLPPSAGIDGVKEEVLACVREKAANACPPLIVGVGIGSTFDKVAGLAKKALMRKVDDQHVSHEVAAFEQELLAMINETNIGANGLGGNTTALSVKVATAPCHIAALPLAINLGCSAMRRTTIDLVAT